MILKPDTEFQTQARITILENMTCQCLSFSSSLSIKNKLLVCGRFSKRRDAALELNWVDYSSLQCSARIFISVASQ